MAAAAVTTVAGGFARSDASEQVVRVPHRPATSVANARHARTARETERVHYLGHLAHLGRHLYAEKVAAQRYQAQLAEIGRRLYAQKVADQRRQEAVRASRSAARTPVGCTPTAGEQFIIQRESGGSVTDWNPVATPTGHAFGLGQLTTEFRVRYAGRLGVNPRTTDYCAQLRMMRMYISERYGSTDAALTFWRAHSWY